MDDLVLNVRQIGQFPATSVANPADVILLQRGGLGGPYANTNPAGIVTPFTNPLANQLNNLQLEFSGFNETLAEFGAAWTEQFNATTAQWTDQFNSTTAQWDAKFAATIEQINCNNQFTINALFENSVRSFNGSRGDIVFTLSDMQQLGAASSHNPRLTGTALLNGDPLTTVGFVRERFEQTFTLNNMLCLGVAPIDSPPLQGRPTAPTPPQGDSSNRLATTMFANRRFRAIEQDIDLRLDEGLDGIIRDINDQIVPMVDAALQALLGDVEFATKDWVNAALAGIDLSGYLPLTGGTLTGYTAINTTGITRFDLISTGTAGGQTMSINGMRGTTAFTRRWNIVLGTGVAAGDNFQINLFSDTGAQNSTAILATQSPLSINRSTGTVTIPSLVNSDQSGYLPLTGGTLSGPGNLTAGITTLQALTMIPCDGTTTSQGIKGSTINAYGEAVLDAEVSGAGWCGITSTNNSSYESGMVTGTMAILVNNTTTTTNGAGILAKTTNPAWISAAIIAQNNAATGGNAILCHGGGSASRCCLGVARFYPDSERVYTLYGDGSVYVHYDGTGTALDINNTGTGIGNSLQIHNGFTNYLTVAASGKTTIGDLWFSQTYGITTLKTETSGTNGLNWYAYNGSTLFSQVFGLNVFYAQLDIGELAKINTRINGNDVVLNYARYLYLNSLIVTIGANDSAGAGYRTLRVPNA